MSKFNPQAPHGTIMGDVHGRCFEQDGKFFNAEGDEWDSTMSPVEADNAEAALRARVEADTRKKVEAELRAKIEAEMRAKYQNAGTQADSQVDQQMGVDGTPLETLGLPPKVITALRGSKIDSVEDLCACTEPQLIGLPNIGTGTLGSIKTVLRKAHKKLAD